jgi:histidinol-phosphatase (PHP family)
MSLTSIIDCHSHSTFSPDSTMSLKEGVEAAHERGLGGLTFTDHIELAHPDPVTWKTPFDIKNRSQCIDELRQEYCHTHNVKILKGLELGFQPTIIERASTMIKQNDFDFVMLSTHVVDDIDLSGMVFYEGKTKELAYKKYLDTIYESVSTFDDFDVVSHIGYVCRYAPYPDKSLSHVDYQDELDAILTKVIAKGKGIEVNTAGLRHNLGCPHPDFDVLKRYKELGGTIITIGSDAHSTPNIGSQFETVVQRLANLGFANVTYFENRTPVFVKI